jgi:hypothetical protein
VQLFALVALAGFAQHVARGLQCLGHERADLGRQVRAQYERLVLVEVPVHRAIQVLTLRRFRRVAALRPAVLAHELLDVRGRAEARDVDEHGFVRGRRDARHRAHLRVRELAAREARADLGQLLERARDAHLRARSNHADAALPVEPVRGARQAVGHVPFIAIELGH